MSPRPSHPRNRRDALRTLLIHPVYGLKLASCHVWHPRHLARSAEPASWEGAAPKNSRLEIVANGIEKIVQGSGAINLLARELLGAGRGLPPEVQLTAPLWFSEAPRLSYLGAGSTSHSRPHETVLNVAWSALSCRRSSRRAVRFLPRAASQHRMPGTHPPRGACEVHLRRSLGVPLSLQVVLLPGRSVPEL